MPTDFGFGNILALAGLLTKRLHVQMYCPTVETMSAHDIHMLICSELGVDSLSALDKLAGVVLEGYKQNKKTKFIKAVMHFKHESLK